MPTLKKLQKLMKISEKCNKNWLATLYLPRNYPIPRYYRYSSMSSVVIGVIDWLSGTIGGIGVRPDILPATGSKVSIGYPRTSASDKRGRIESYRHRLRSVTECPRLTKVSIEIEIYQKVSILNFSQSWPRVSCYGTLGSCKSCRQSIPIWYQYWFSRYQPWHRWPNAIISQ